MYCMICSIYFYTVHENMYNYAQLYLHNLVNIIWAKHRKNDICKQKLIEYRFFDLQNFPSSMPLETEGKTIESNHRGIKNKQALISACSKSIGFRFSTFPTLSYLIDIMNLIKTRCVTFLWEKTKQENIKQDQPPSRFLFFPITFPAPFARRPNGPRWVRVCLNVRELEDHVSRISLKFLHVIFLKKLLIVSCCPPKNPRSGRF